MEVDWVSGEVSVGGWGGDGAGEERWEGGFVGGGVGGVGGGVVGEVEGGGEGVWWEDEVMRLRWWWDVGRLLPVWVCEDW